MTNDNAADFIPKEKHLKRKLVIDNVKIDDNISVVGKCNDNHPVVRLLRLSLADEKANIATHIAESEMYVVATAKGKALFANRFAVRSDEDILYYLLAVCEHLEIPASQTQVMSTSTVPNLVRKYFEVRIF